MPLRTPVVITALSSLLLTGCGTGSPTPGSTPTEPAQATSTSSISTPTAHSELLAGKVIAIDPGHNGGNMRGPAEISKQVPDGRGGTKACNTTGTAAADGFAEHRFNWLVATELRKSLEKAGAKTIMSRDSDDGVGPCVDKRGTFADSADILVSIHANGADNTKAYGFGAIIAPDREHGKAKRLATALVNGMKDEDFRANPGFGKNTIIERTDLGGLNNASVPAVLMELGEMRNPGEAKVMKTTNGQKRYAMALAKGIESYFAHPGPKRTPEPATMTP